MSDRGAFRDLVEQLLDQNIIKDGDDGALIRHYDQRARELDDALVHMTSEYQRRLQEDGAPAAKQWLRKAAEALGYSHGEQTRNLLSSLSWRQGMIH